MYSYANQQKSNLSTKKKYYELERGEDMTFQPKVNKQKSPKVKPKFKYLNLYENMKASVENGKEAEKC